MRWLFWIFIGMFWYGLLVGPLGPGLIAFAMAVFMYCAEPWLRRQDTKSKDQNQNSD